MVCVCVCGNCFLLFVSVLLVDVCPILALWSWRDYFLTPDGLFKKGRGFYSAADNIENCSLANVFLNYALIHKIFRIEYFLAEALTPGGRVTCLKAGPCEHRRCVSRAVFLSRCVVYPTGLPVVKGQDLEWGGPASAGEVERAAGNRGAAGLHSAPTRHRYADTLCRSLSFCLSVRPSASDGPRSAAPMQLPGLTVRVLCCRVRVSTLKTKNTLDRKQKIRG